MSVSVSLSFGKEFFDSREAELRAAAKKLYADPDERAIVATVLIPQLRAFLAPLLGEEQLLLSPREVNALCSRVDELLEENKTLLHTDGLLKPLMPAVNTLREQTRGKINENFKHHCREILKRHGITDRVTLFTKGSEWFKKTEFPPYKKGPAFAGRILGRVIKNQNITRAILEEIADELGFTKLSENEQLEAYRILLASFGIINRATLLSKGVEWFRKAEFAPYGYGTGLAIKILGRTVANVTLKILDEISVRLGFADASEETRLAAFHSLLESKGVTNRAELLAKGAEWFKNTEFAPYGKGTAFASQILGRTVEKVNMRVLEEVADRLGFPRLSEEEQLEEYRSLLASKKIVNRTDLLSNSMVRFAKTEFSPYGKGRAFASRILGRTINRITHEILEEIADKLGW